MQIKAIAFNIHPSTSYDNTECHPALKVWQSLYYELINAGYCKQEIADWIQLSPRSVNRLITGSTKQPSFKVLSRMLHAYCCCSLHMNADVGGDQ
ncbi:MAG TPA: hypothetical protein VI522_00720 [Gammaproteobacteria bacterium]|nr:hypothetical protein [Gammaproteobacteria bacterium]